MRANKRLLSEDSKVPDCQKLTELKARGKKSAKEKDSNIVQKTMAWTARRARIRLLKRLVFF